MPDQQPARWPLLVSSENRDSSSRKDAKLVNGYVEITESKEKWVYKRPGLVVNTTLTAGAGSGVFNWLGNIYTIIGSVLYKNGVSAATGLDTTGGVYTFSTSLGATPKLFFQNGVKAYTFDGTTLVTMIATVTTVLNGTIKTNRKEITGLSSTAALAVGAGVIGDGVADGSTVVTIDSSTQVTIDRVIPVIPMTHYEGIIAATIITTISLTSVTPSPSALPIGALVALSDNPTQLYSITSVGASTLVATMINPIFTWASWVAGQTVSIDVTIKSKTVSLSFSNPGVPPAGFVKGSGYLNGTTYMLTPSSYVNGSSFNNPAVWPVMNYLTAMIEPDAGVFLTRQLTYVVAMKLYSVESFYDAGNAAGSPLGPVPGVKLNVGCKTAGSVQAVEGILFWVGQTRGGSYMIMKMENMKAETISTPSIEKLLQAVDYTVTWSWAIRLGGHLFYGVTFKNSNLTLVYDSSTGAWAHWTDAVGNYLPFVASTNAVNQKTLLQHETDGKLYNLDAEIYNDYGTLFAVDIYTPNWDAGVRVMKFLKLMDFVGDQNPGSFLQVRNSDDDYQTWSNFRTVDLSKKRPYLADCGSFRRRALHIRHYANTPMRLQAVELQMELGTL